MKKDKSLSISRRPYLTKGQTNLYALIVKKISENKSVNIQDAKDLYLAYGCKEIRGGVPCTFNYWANHYTLPDGTTGYKGAYEPMPQSMIERYATLWIMTNIGSLVIKGYLKIIPQIEFGKIQINKITPINA